MGGHTRRPRRRVRSGHVGAGVAQAQLVACYEPALAAHPGLAGRAQVSFSITAAGVTSPEVEFVDASVVACVRDVLAALRFPPIEELVTATGIIRFSPGPSDCERVWRIGPRARACERDGRIDLVERTDGAPRVTWHVPGTLVYDASEDWIVVAGPCFSDDPGDVACVVDSGHSPDSAASVANVYLHRETASLPGFRRGVVSSQSGEVLATNGRAIVWSDVTNKSSGEVADVQAELSADGLRADSCPEWRVIEPLHREGARFVMTFEECSGRSTSVALAIDAQGEIHWRRIDDEP